MEAVTAFVEGPGCYTAVYGMLLQRPWTSTAQILVSAGQLYGTVLYFVTSLLEGTPHPCHLMCLVKQNCDDCASNDACPRRRDAV